MSLNLAQIDVIESITKKDFIKNYFKPQKPLVIKSYIKNWPAFSKWD